jgi:hypothetical protein
MNLSSGYLTSKQKIIWGLKESGIPEADIGRKLKITRQTVNRAVSQANSKILQSLEETAKLNKIDIEKINAKEGFLAGYSSHFRTKAFVTFSSKNGVQVWYKHEGDCQKCKRLKACREMLLEEAQSRSFLVTEDIDNINPSRLADALFSRIEGGYEKHE